MKTRVTIALGVVSILAVGLAYGQTQSSMGRLDIPFKFWVGKKEMPAGKYEFGRETGQLSRVLLRNLETKSATFVPVIERLAGMKSSENQKPRVVFDTVGSERFLSEFWPGGNRDGYLLGITKGEEKHEVVTQN